MVNCFIGIMSGCMLMKRGIISGKQRLHYYEQLAELYPTIGKASTEIINLQSIYICQKARNIFCRIYMGNLKHFPTY